MSELTTAADALLLMQALEEPDRRLVDQLYRLCMRHVAITVTTEKRRFDCVFDIPMVRADYGLFDVQAVRAALITKLRNNGFRALPLSKINRIYLNWCPPDVCRKMLEEAKQKEQERRRQEARRSAGARPSLPPPPHPNDPEARGLRFNRPRPFTRESHDRMLKEAHLRRAGLWKNPQQR